MNAHTTRRRAAIAIALGLVAAFIGFAGPMVYARFADTSAKDRIAAAPPPALFGDKQVARVDELVDPESAKAAELMRQWWAAHDRKKHDKEFAAWLIEVFPAPPSESDRKAEMREIETLNTQRSPEGISAATWLEAYGKKDVWKLYAHDQAELLPAATGEAHKQAVKDMLKMSKSVADELGQKFKQSAPYVLEPALRTDHIVKPGDVCPCSYPSRHAAAAAASRTYLGAYEPHRVPEYRWMEDEIDFSRLYMAGHVPSDISGGALLGDLIGEYFQVTRAS